MQRSSTCPNDDDDHPAVPALAGALVVAGLLGVRVGLRRAPERAPTQRHTLIVARARVARVTARTRVLLAVGLLAGVAVAVMTGWVIAIVLVPAAVAGLPVLLSAPPATARIDRLQAMEEWTRSLAGVLTVGIGLEQALIATLRSTPAAIRPEVSRLVARLRARWPTEDALRVFANELDDATGDMVAANLILGARRRGAGLASILEALAESVAADVRARRQIEADRAKPRATPLGHPHHHRRPRGPRGHRQLHRALRLPARAGHPRRPAQPVCRDAGVDAEDGHRHDPAPHHRDAP